MSVQKLLDGVAGVKCACVTLRRGKGIDNKLVEAMTWFVRSFRYDISAALVIVVHSRSHLHNATDPLTPSFSATYYHL